MSDIRAFIELLTPGAQEVQRQRKMFACVTIAQAIWETGAGKSVPHDRDTQENSYNLFGRKARDGEPYVTSMTWEVYGALPQSFIRYEKLSGGQYKVWIWDRFKKFNSYSESVLDRTSFLELEWYQKACNADNPFDAARFLIDTGFPGYAYATDPAYAEGIISVINTYNLTQYDLPKGEQDDMNQVLGYDQWAWDELTQWIGDAYNDKFLENYDWYNKAANKQLTYADLMLLKVLIDDRRRTGKVVRQ